MSWQTEQISFDSFSLNSLISTAACLLIFSSSEVSFCSSPGWFGLLTILPSGVTKSCGRGCWTLCGVAGRCWRGGKLAKREVRDRLALGFSSSCCMVFEDSLMLGQSEKGKWIWAWIIYDRVNVWNSHCSNMNEICFSKNILAETYIVEYFFFSQIYAFDDLILLLSIHHFHLYCPAIFCY